MARLNRVVPSVPSKEDFNETHYRVGGRYYWLPNFYTGVSVDVNGSEAFSIADSGDIIRIEAGYSWGKAVSDSMDSLNASDPSDSY